MYYHANFLSTEEADAAYQDLFKNTKWEKTAKINRWVSLCTAVPTKRVEGEVSNAAARDYKYRDAPGATVAGFPESVLRIQQKVQEWYATEFGKLVEFNVCLLNFYEDGQQRIGWHSDREEIGRDTPIASVSLGAPRTFMIRSKTNGVQDRASLTLQPGSLVIMLNQCQHQYLHSVPREGDVTEGRINLTFRCKNDTTTGEEEHERRDNWLDSIIDGAAPDPQGWSSSRLPFSSSATSNAGTDSLSAAMGTTQHGVFGDRVPTVDLPPGMSNLWFLIKTNLGAECYCAAEVLELLTEATTGDNNWLLPCSAVARPCHLDGFVGVLGTGAAGDKDEYDASMQLLIPKLLQLRTAHHVLRYHCHFDLMECCTNDFPTPETVDGETLYQYFKRCLVEGSASISTIQGQESVTFRVTSDRIGGPHAFNRTEVELSVAMFAFVIDSPLDRVIEKCFLVLIVSARHSLDSEIGGAISEFYDQSRPKMQDYDLNIRADVVGYIVVIGTQLNVQDLSKERHFLRYRNTVTIKVRFVASMQV